MGNQQSLERNNSGNHQLNSENPSFGDDPDMAKEFKADERRESARLLASCLNFNTEDSGAAVEDESENGVREGFLTDTEANDIITENDNDNDDEELPPLNTVVQEESSLEVNEDIPSKKCLTPGTATEDQPPLEEVNEDVPTANIVLEQDSILEVIDNEQVKSERHASNKADSENKNVEMKNDDQNIEERRISPEGAETNIDDDKIEKTKTASEDALSNTATITQAQNTSNTHNQEYFHTLLANGVNCVKYSRKGKAQRRSLFISDDKTEIKWKKNSNKTFILSDLKDVVSENAGESLNLTEVEREKTLSLIFRQRSLHFMFNSTEEKNTLSAGFKEILENQAMQTIPQ
mmetsp:Transcript_19470/g.25141  ORF Transcript_19470/g.25141 Transcript_19470/m.25141 type:complete len:349 (+) Transcript_19470:155-1201(+)